MTFRDSAVRPVRARVRRGVAGLLAAVAASVALPGYAHADEDPQAAFVCPTPAEMDAATGLATTDVVPGLSECHYDAGSRSLTVSIAEPESAQDYLATAGGTAVKGVGDGATYLDGGDLGLHYLWARFGSEIYTVQVTGDSVDSQSMGAAAQLLFDQRAAAASASAPTPAELTCPRAAVVSGITGFDVRSQKAQGPGACEYVRPADSSAVVRLVRFALAGPQSDDYMERVAVQPGIQLRPDMADGAGYRTLGAGELLDVRFGDTVVAAFSSAQVVGPEKLFELASLVGDPVPPASSAPPSPAAPTATVPAAPSAALPAPAPVTRERVDGPVAATSGPAPISRALPKPSEAFGMPESVIAALVTLLAITLITFPAEMFNRTLEENYAAISAGWRRRTAFLTPLLRPRSGPVRGIGIAEQPGDAPPPQRSRGWRGFAIVTLIGGLLGSLLNPSFGFNEASAVGYVGALVTVLFGAALSAGIAAAYRSRRGVARHFSLTGLPGGLAIAAGCVLLSRAVDFQPGYLYGVLAGVAFAVAMSHVDEGRLTAISTAVSLGVGTAAWFMWAALHETASADGAGFGLAMLDTVLASLFVGAVVGASVGAIPVRFMPGYAIWAWSKPAWAAVTGAAVFGLVSIMLNPASGPTHPGGAPLATVLILFVVFAGASVAFRQYWARRTAGPARPAADAEPADSPA